MKKEVFNFRVQSLSYGWCRVFMLVNDKRIDYNASYLGDNPLASFIEACEDFLVEGGDYHIVWQQEPGMMKIDLHLDENRMLHLDITDANNRENGCYEAIPNDSFLQAVICEGFRVLNAFGLYGYRCSWQNRTDFPLTSLLRITGECKELWKGDSCCTDISKEIACLHQHITLPEITQETRMNDCTIYYESWQIQCCGKPFSVGDSVGWTVCSPSKIKNAHGVMLDFDEDHHGFPTHRIEGVITKIIVERSEFPKGMKETWYDRANVIHEEIQTANGQESSLPDDESTERTFWGYIVTLKDVTVKPLE